MIRLISLGSLCLALVACGDAIDRLGTTPTDDGGSVVGDDSGAGMFADAAAVDASDPPEDDSEPVLAREGTSDSPSLAGMDACYTEDACDPDTCSGVRSCCVGSGACCAPMGADSVPTVGLSSSCSDFTDAGDCLLPGMTPFGDPLPYIFGGAIVPNGDGDGDSGLLADTTVDLTVHRAVLSATIQTPVGCGDGCLETVGLGMTSQSVIDGSVRVIASLLYSAARDRMTLMVGEAQAAMWSGITDGEEWTLRLLPSGVVEVRRDGAVPAEYEPLRYDPHPNARLVVYGRTVNPTSGGEPSRALDVNIDVTLCDVPDAWTGRAPLPVALSGGGALAPADRPTAPSLIQGSRTLLAYESEGAIWLAEDTGSGFVAQDAPIVTADEAEPWRNEAVGDPELVERLDGTGFTLFFTAHETGGLPSIGRLDLDNALEPLADGGTRQVARGALVEADELSQPTVFQNSRETWVMIARAVENGVAHLRVLRSDDAGQNWSHHRTSALDTLTARSGARTSSGFDSDDISHPALVVHNGAWQLHYSGRRGTRSGVGLLLSDDLVNWRFHRDGEAVLTPAASVDEQVGVYAADVVTESFGLTMVYVADDGYQRRLYSTSRRATDSGTF